MTRLLNGGALAALLASSALAAEPESCATVRFSDVGWSDITSTTAVATTILEALQEASDTGRDFKMLYRDLLNFVRNLLLISGGANASMLAGVSPEDLPAMQNVAGNFSYTDLLRIANLLLRDDETVNKAEHQRLAVEIALLKAATFPRLKSVEQVIAGDARVATASPSTKPRTRASAPADDRRCSGSWPPPSGPLGWRASPAAGR